MVVAQQPPYLGQQNDRKRKIKKVCTFLIEVGLRMLIGYLIWSVLRGYSSETSQTLDRIPDNSFVTPNNLFELGKKFDVYVYLSSYDKKFRDFANTNALLWTVKGLVYGDWTSGENNDGSRTHSMSIPTPEVLQKNGSLYLHVFMLKDGMSPNPKEENYAKNEMVYGSFQLNRYRKKYYRLTSNLLTGETAQTEDERRKAEQQIKYEILNYWHPNITVNLVHDNTPWQRNYSILFFNNYWNLGNEYSPVNHANKTLNLTLTYAPLTLFKWQLYNSQHTDMMNGLVAGDVIEDNDDRQDTFKQVLLDTNPYVLAATVIVSFLHIVLEFLAIRNDLEFWKTRKSLEGLSVRSILFNVFQSVVVFLYICDNEASWIVKLSLLAEMGVELWKVSKVMDIQVKRDEKFFGIFPKVIFSDKGSYVESSTKEYDEMAFKYLSWLLFPLLGSYAVYALMYNEYRGWYSFILGMLYGFLLTFGFIAMTPQLFINYKLKSVAHLPWRMLTYKFLNTFIDDLFAFIIRMPTMYRLGCFRDDIIFLIYLYQRWAYRVDPKRVNEFGTSMEHPKGIPEEKEQTTTGTAANEVKETKKKK